jgi:type I restriction enzyme S subunit
MSSEYPLLPLGTVASVRSGYAFKSADMGTEGHPLIKIGSIVPPRVDISSCDRIGKEVIGKTPGVERYLLKEGDILIAMTGATAGKTGRFPATDEECFLNQRVGKVYPKDKSSIDQEYLYQVLSRQGFADEILSLADGSAQGNISGALIETYKVPIPPLQIQKAIAHILGTLDDKIKLNRKNNETLEAMAKALFKSWFVDFDPVRAKAEGRSTRLPAEISDLFPDSFEDSELGEIPSGWSVAALSDIAHVSTGKRPALIADSRSSANDIPVYGGAGVMGYTCSALTDGEPVLATGRVGTLGVVNRVLEKAWISDNTLIINPGKINFVYAYHFLLGQDLKSLNRGSTQPLLSQADLKELPIARPPASVLSVFCELTQYWQERQSTLLKENVNIKALLDALLPKLISGEIRISDAETMLEEVGV